MSCAQFSGAGADDVHMPITPTYTTYTEPVSAEITTSFQDCPVDSLHVQNGDLMARFNTLDFPKLGTKNSAIAAPAAATNTE